VCVLDSSANLDGRIALLPNADPGFDWIFSRKIAGFVTAYGGANSHMAVRAGELGLPAVIGAGESLFHAWSQARRLRIDCLNRQVQILA
jgi:glutamine kinase